MSGKRIQLKRGTTAQNSTFTGLNGEVTVDTTKKTLVVHDGTTMGGTVLAKDSDVVLKVDKVVGKQLSTEDYTTAEKSKLAGIASSANNYTHPASGVGAGIYRSVTVDTNGHITAGTNPTTVSGYGLTDAHTKTEVSTLLALKINNSEKGVANGVATLDANGKVVLTQIPDSVLGQLEYQGVWDFTTLPTATQKGQYWIASVSGNGYIVGDWAVWNGLSFDKVGNTDAVASVAGRTGNVVLTKLDVGLDLVDNTADNTKNVLSATKWTTPRNIALTGDVTGNINIDGSANVSIATTIAANSVALGTDTTGNYVAGNTAGTGITVTGTAGEGWSPTISIDSTVATLTGAQTLTNKTLQDSTTFIVDNTDATKKVQFDVAGVTTATTRTMTIPNVNGTLITTGDTGTVTSTMIADGTIINADISASAGIVDTKLATISTAGKVSNSATTATNLNTASTIVARDASGNFSAENITATLTGNSSTATTLQTARTINGVSFNGSANITIADNTKLPLTGGTLTGDIQLGANKLSFSATTPDIAWLNYGDRISAGSTLARGVNVGNLLISNAWSDSSKVPTNGAYIKGNIAINNTPTVWTTASVLEVGGLASYGNVFYGGSYTTGGAYFGSNANYNGGWLYNATTNRPAVMISLNETGVGSIDFNVASAGTSNSAITWKKAVTIDNNGVLNASFGIAGTSFNSITGLASVAPIVAGTAAVGTSTLTARQDHVHPAQTTITGNASTATTLQTARTISMSGAITGTATSFDGSANITIPTTVSTTQGGIIYGSSATAYGTTAAGTSGYILSSNGTSAPTWVENTLLAFPGSTFKKSARVATTAALTLNAATATIDGVTLTAIDRVLIKNQATASQNGIYTGVTTTTWTRTTDSDSSSDIASAVVAIDEGTANGGRLFTNTFKATDTLGTTAMAWYEVVYNSGTWAISTTGSAATLTTGRTIGMTGDVTWTSASFNGSANVTGTSTLATITDSGTGTFKKITTDTKGRVTGTQAVAQADITGLLGAGSITNTMIANTAVANLSGTNTGDQTITLTGDITGSGTGSFATTLANSGVTAGTYSKVTVDGKGRVTAGSTQTMEDIPDATFKRSVRAATTANITLSAPQSIDGIALVAGDRVLVKDQTTTSQNGIYVVAAGEWTRALDADTSSKIASALVAVDSGTVNGGKLFDNDFKTTDTLGTTSMTWSSNLDSGSLSSTTPLVAGTAAIGTGTTVARADHVHPAQATITGNAGTATTLQTARTISGVSFNGSANIDIEDRLGTAKASAATVTIGTSGLGDYFHITGTTTITSLGTANAAGIRRTLIFDGALTLTHNATSLICPGAANIVTVAGTVIEVVAETTANWRVVSITHPSLSMAELGYLDGVTSAIQTQLNAKAALASPALTGTPTAPTAASTVSSTQIATTAFAVPRTSTTGSARLPVGTTGQRDASPVDGMIRYNSTTMGFEGYFNGQWQSVGGGQMFGNSSVKAVSYNAQTISENITVTAGLNAYSVGDITINNGYTMTVENGSVYKIL